MIRKIVLNLIKVYQSSLSPDHGFFKISFLGCRFYPSCSEYSHRAIIKYGLGKGGWLSIKRVSRCHPFNKGGVDNLP